MARSESKYGVKRSDFPTRQAYETAWQREFRKSDKGKSHTRRMNTRSKGITPEKYDELLKQQDGKCAVCGKTDPGTNQHGPQSFCVDHDKTCCPGVRSCGNCVRGLLCHNCNRAEGLLNGNAQALANYLARYRRDGAPMRVYCAGPMSGYPELNYPAFASASDRLRQRGFEVVSPAELNPITTPYRDAMRKDILALIECDHILRLEGWEKSKGATLENHIAEVMGIPVLVDCNVCEYHHLEGACGGDSEAT